MEDRERRERLGAERAAVDREPAGGGEAGDTGDRGARVSCAVNGRKRARAGEERRGGGTG